MVLVDSNDINSVVRLQAVRKHWVMLLAHWLYSNATVKGEHLIPSTWDMFHEKFGWMLNFWNVTGVPFLYCFQSFYILKHGEAISRDSSTLFTAALVLLLLVGYYIFDTANSQKALLKNPSGANRKLFPNLPWRQISEPVECIETP
jgi:delta24(24(1))-sterol reductase